MKKITLITCCYFIFVGLYAQNRKYDIEESYTKEIINHSKQHPSVYEVEEKVLKHNKYAFVLKDTIDATSLSGIFLKLNAYFIMNDTHSQYSKYELVSEERINELGVSERHVISNNCNTLIVNLEDGKYYVAAYDFLDRFDYTQRKKELDRLANLDKKRKYKISKTFDLKYPIKQFKSMISECKMYTNRLEQHSAIAKRGNMTKAEIRAWKKDIVAAKLLDFRISDFVDAYENATLEDDSNFINPLNEYDLFSKTLIVARRSSE